eukprot:TRINITY_DN6765_c0_g1_i1.p2 TRINITY_DN6765_c0_g1~~TRINITY_DN6765_c0_g1_i1.p2  ORF type:complete len:204 (-),score=48.82 TRINITY_DN6765_c0_g1_i1:1569-2180(-)
MHVKFPALVRHQDLTITKFLSLDKCLPRRNFLQVVEVACDPGKEKKLFYDLEWLSVLRNTCHLDSTNVEAPLPSDGERYNFTPTDEEISEIQKLFPNGLEIPTNFEMTVPAHDMPQTGSIPKVNPQTKNFLSQVDMPSSYLGDFSRSRELANHDQNLSSIDSNTLSGTNDNQINQNNPNHHRTANTCVSVDPYEMDFGDEAFN